MRTSIEFQDLLGVLTQNGNFLTLALGISLLASKPVWKGSHARYDQEVSLVARPMNIV